MSIDVKPGKPPVYRVEFSEEEIERMAIRAASHLVTLNAMLREDARNSTKSTIAAWELILEKLNAAKPS
jgi:hypothetical protein